MIPVTKIIEWMKSRGKHNQYGWAYECGCDAPLGARSEPYCPKHGMKLLRYKAKLTT
jgi:hypothetical protein